MFFYNKFNIFNFFKYINLSTNGKKDNVLSLNKNLQPLSKNLSLICPLPHKSNLPLLQCRLAVGWCDEAPPLLRQPLWGCFFHTPSAIFVAPLTSLLFMVHSPVMNPNCSQCMFALHLFYCNLVLRLYASSLDCAL